MKKYEEKFNKEKEQFQDALRKGLAHMRGVQAKSAPGVTFADLLANAYIIGNEKNPNYMAKVVYLAIWQEFDFAEDLSIGESKELMALADLILNLQEYGIKDEKPGLMRQLDKYVKKFKLVKKPDDYEII